jgi:hypothetical protein
MSFIKSDNSAKVYAPGYFIARGDETVKRETREIKQDGAITAENGSKYVPMGTIYPANDATAEGIVYEDVDVTTGDMPGSVVLDGCVYTERLAPTGVDYNAVTPETGDNPSEKGWYTRSGSEGAYVYTLTTDTTVQSGTTYYDQIIVTISSAAKTALQGKGFVFIDTVPAVTRPY